MIRILGLIFTSALACSCVAHAADDSKYTIKQTTTSPPNEVSEPIRKLLGDKSIQLSGSGTVICDLWLRAELPAKATPEQIKNGLTYRELEESTVVGAVRFEQEWSDYRKQKVKPGVYTLRLGFQPMDGDHMGTAPYSEFCLVVPANADQKPGIMEAKGLRELSAKANGGSHPTVLLLFPNEKPEDKPRLVDKGNNTWVLMVKAPISVDGKSGAAALGLGLTLIGESSAP